MPLVFRRTDCGYVANAEAVAYLTGLSVKSVRRHLASAERVPEGALLLYVVTPELQAVLDGVRQRVR